ncbi:MAG: nucleotidyl transferase AbiEii/AbiGii toxin family protein [Chloroflexi bacterium HGW-Chloroflexi-3]|nr:MAG: nucleotidyl transferase AbiEii/AbiGii toxin family protein [Chloroflexi bacterium HGW-Chloroflexi-3]
MQFKAKIKNLALKNHIPAQAVLQNFMLERLLERISLSKYKDMVILKGGMLIASLVGISSRTTMDMDATLRGYPLSEETIREALSEICAMPLDDEVTLVFDHVVPIREDDEYGGYRVALIAKFESINTPLKIDITTGDIITPDAIRYAFQSNFEDKKIEVWAYNIETILAEKVETILRRSVLNTRPRDYYDVYIIMKTQRRAINKNLFRTALNATAQKRMSLAALRDRDKILQSIQTDTIMRQRWERYCKENYYANGIEFDVVIGILKELVS